jgi:type IV secretion system protein VirB8
MNPLGYQIATYRRDAETTQPISVAPPPAPAQALPQASVAPTGVDPMATTGAVAPTNGVAVPPANAATPAPNVAPPSPSPAATPSKTGNPNGEEFPAQ